MNKNYICAIVLGVLILIAFRDAIIINQMKSEDAGGASREFADSAKKGLIEYLQIEYDNCVKYEGGEGSLSCEAIKQQIEDAEGIGEEK